VETIVRTRILEHTGAIDITDIDLIQPLWNDYGTLSRVHLAGGRYQSVIVKQIRIPEASAHPKGFTGSISKNRKIRSYQVETHWYQNQNRTLTCPSVTPKCLAAFENDEELFLLLEDLAEQGYTQDLYTVSWREIEVVLKWLAHFHAQLIESTANGLWSAGTYWHLATRPEELSNIEGTQLHAFAGLLDARLQRGKYQTLVHGDAKLANFLFSQDHDKVAAVDFQYVGRGCAMKDVAYFIGSCMSSSECEQNEKKVLDVYFCELRKCLPSNIDASALEAEWRWLYPLAWADFERFLLGWSPIHKKLTDYSDETTRRALHQVSEELLDAARTACVRAGRYIQSQRGVPLQVSSKGFSTVATDVVTQIDIEAQRIILEELASSIDRYDLGILAEEGPQNESRLQKYAFWSIDPLDGTKFFIDGKPGYATSIALVSKSGHTILGVVYDPVQDNLYETVIGQGVKVNGKSLSVSTQSLVEDSKITWFADQSLRGHPCFACFDEKFELRFIGGAVTNILQLMTVPRSCYCKAPKPELGGCAIWDLAAVSLMLTELEGTAEFYDGSSLNLNRPESIFHNDVGLAFTSPDLSAREVVQFMKSLGYGTDK